MAEEPKGPSAIKQDSHSTMSSSLSIYLPLVTNSVRLNIILVSHLLLHRGNFPCGFATKMARNSSVGIATCYGLDGPGIVPCFILYACCGNKALFKSKKNSHHSRPAMELTQFPIKRMSGLFPAGKALRLQEE